MLGLFLSLQKCIFLRRVPFLENDWPSQKRKKIVCRHLARTVAQPMLVAVCSYVRTVLLSVPADWMPGAQLQTQLRPGNSGAEGRTGRR